MRFCSNVIILRAFMFSDTKMMVDTLSKEEGRMSCVMSVSSSKKSKGKRQIFQPLSILELELERKTPGQIATIKDAHIIVPFTSIPFHPYKLTISIFLAEFLSNATRSEQDTALLYDYVSESIQWFDNVKEGFSNFHLVFMMRLTRFIGFYPNVDDYTDGCSFDLQNGCFVKFAPQQRGFLSPEDTKKMQLIMRMNYETMRFFKMSHTERNRCLDVILDFYRLHVPGFREMKSLSVLRDMFS
ncbi:MAG TPA: DNA repair protein RecO [Prevotella sp.]|nr:DNA repair protein RecO [Prevotella sp.]